MAGTGGRILTTHVGSLPRPKRLLELELRRSSGEEVDAAEYEQQLSDAVTDVVRHQKEAGVDLINDGEVGHTMGFEYDFGSWYSYIVRRLGGVEVVEVSQWEAKMAANPTASDADEVVLGSFLDRRDRARFDEAYADPHSGCALPEQFLSHWSPIARGPITYIGQEALQRNITQFKAALAAAGVEDGWMNSVAPGSCRFPTDYYESDDELLYATAEALREEYKAIIDAGLILQLDDPAVAENWDQVKEEPSIEAYRRFAMKRVDALNHAIRDLPSERIRYHLCWGSWHGPHVTDIPISHLIDVMLAVNASAYSFEAANVRHEHEWELWKDVKLPEGKKILPGIVSHATNVVEHPDLVAQRIIRFADAVGPDSVVASTDCGLGGRVHPQIAWAKLEALSQGAAIASKRLYG
jgi:5-methyltetrahydropteroyltriglutamate--homocysteine methyltransferase